MEHQAVDDSGEDAPCPLDSCPDEVVALVMEPLPPLMKLRVMPDVSQRLGCIAMDRMSWRRTDLVVEREGTCWEPLDPQHVDEFLEILNAAPVLRSLDLRKVPTLLSGPSDGSAFWVPGTALVDEGRLCLDRGLELRELACSAYLTGLPDLLRKNARTLRRLVLTDLFEPGPYIDGPFLLVDTVALLEQLASVMHAVSGLHALESIELEGQGLSLDYYLDYEDQKRAAYLVFFALLGLPSLRSLTTSELGVLAETALPGDRQPAPGSMRLENITFAFDSNICDSFTAGLVLASRDTLRVCWNPKIGPLTLRALRQCPKLEECSVPSLDELLDLSVPAPPPMLRRVDVLYYDEKRCTAEDLERCSVLEQLEELSLDGARPVALLSVLMRRCTRLKTLTIRELQMLNIIPAARLGPPDNPVVLLELLDGAMPQLEKLCVRIDRFHPAWEEPLKRLQEKRPWLRVE